MRTQPTQSSQYNWTKDIEPYLKTLASVEGGFTPAKRGVTTLADGKKVFVKLATDLLTKKWLQKEIKVYRLLNEAGYGHIAELLAVSDDLSGMAITYLEGFSFENTWDDRKLAAVMEAQKALKEYKHLFVDDPDFTYFDYNRDTKWPELLRAGSIDRLHKKCVKFGIYTKFDGATIAQFAADQVGWDLRRDTLIHEDIRADNFGYNPHSGQGILIDWNWLCIGDEGLDTTPLLVNVYQSGFNPYVRHPEKYNPQILKYLVGFWADAVLKADEDANQTEWKLRAAQARNAVTCYELLENPTYQKLATAAG